MVSIEKCMGYNNEYKCENNAIHDGFCNYCLSELFRTEVKNLLIKIWNILSEVEDPIIGTRCDVFITKVDLGKINVRFCIECKSNVGMIEEQAVINFISNFSKMKHQNTVDMGIIVSRDGFSSDAKNAANKANITLFTIGDLKKIVKMMEKEDFGEIENMKSSYLPFNVIGAIAYGGDLDGI